MEGPGKHPQARKKPRPLGRATTSDTKRDAPSSAPAQPERNEPEPSGENLALDPERIGELRELFSMADSDKSGKLEPEELSKLLDQIGANRYAVQRGRRRRRRRD